jgi:hypothetical protein
MKAAMWSPSFRTVPHLPNTLGVFVFSVFSFWSDLFSLSFNMVFLGSSQRKQKQIIRAGKDLGGAQLLLFVFSASYGVGG